MAHVSFPNGFERLPKRLVYAQVNVQRRTFQIAKTEPLSATEWQYNTSVDVTCQYASQFNTKKKNFSSKCSHSNGQTVYLGALWHHLF